MSKDKATYRIFSSFDTETTNVKVDGEWVAFPVAYMFGDLYKIDITKYNVGDEEYHIYRNDTDALDHIRKLIELGRTAGVVPIVIAYNLMFDLQSIIYKLNSEYRMKALAQSSTNVYTLDMYDGDNDIPVLRFWDCFHLDMRGLAAMGDVCGMPKLKGDWDYSLVRTPDTPLTELEEGYARRDVQVLPAYIRYLYEANRQISKEDFGNRVITKTSIVRQMAQKEIGNVQLSKYGNKQNLFTVFSNFCMGQFPDDFETYGIRKACFRGGFTFTAAKTAMVPVRRVCSLDVTSMHHAFINGRKVPANFRKSRPELMDFIFSYTVKRSMQEVLDNYDKPFEYAFHGQFMFTNIRLKKGSCFDDWGIGLIPRGKFAQDTANDPEYMNGRNIAAENQTKMAGFVDRCQGGVFAFSKLMSADKACIFLNEVEAWCVAQVYEWDDCTCLQGESTMNFYTPPDYVTLQSMRLYKAKDETKQLLKEYRQGVVNQGINVPEMLSPMTEEIRNGNVTVGFLESFYTSTVKGMFNGIYGTMAQDVLKPDYRVESGDLSIDRDTLTTKENFEDKVPSRCKVLYTYGMRIVGGSRQHLVIAMMLMYAALGVRVDVTGGDTDSLKIRCDADVTPDMLLGALEPLHRAVTGAIQKCTARAKHTAPQWASGLDHVGCFEVEGGDNVFYDWHMELWNKARVSWNGCAHVTCAGLSRPEGMYNIEDAIEDLVADGMDVPDALRETMGYNVCVAHDVCHAIEHRKPAPWDTLDCDIVDYMGVKRHVSSPQAVALYPADRLLGDTSKAVNMESLIYLNSRYGRFPDVGFRMVRRGDDGRAVVERMCY